MRKATFDGRFDQIGCEEGQRDRHIDLSDAAVCPPSPSGEKFNAPFRQGIRIGSVKDGKVTAFITERGPKSNMPEGVAADKDGNVFGGFTDKQNQADYPIYWRKSGHEWLGRLGQLGRPQSV